MDETVEILAPPEQVWHLLRGEAQAGVDEGQAAILSEVRGRELLLEVQMGVGFRVQHAFRLERRGQHCLVSNRVRPLGWRWRLSNVFLFGRGIRPLEAAATQGLRNLKATAEAEEEKAP
jgi:hypothetical protein